jgi:hypothetical protein
MSEATSGAIIAAEPGFRWRSIRATRFANRPPLPKERAMVERWVNENGLTWRAR